MLNDINKVCQVYLEMKEQIYWIGAGEGGGNNVRKWEKKPQINLQERLNLTRYRTTFVSECEC